MYKAFLIKYGEIGVKGKNRYLFEDALVRQIRYALKEVDGEFHDSLILTHKILKVLHRNSIRIL